MLGRSILRHSLALALLAIGACTATHEVARQARLVVVGMDTTTLQLCAGSPRNELWSYENKYERTGGLEITLPIIGGGIAAGGSGSYCHALVHILDGRVTGVTYAGDNDDFIGREGVCAPVFRACLREQQKAREAPRGTAG